MNLCWTKNKKLYVNLRDIIYVYEVPKTFNTHKVIITSLQYDCNVDCIRCKNAAAYNLNDSGMCTLSLKYRLYYVDLSPILNQHCY